MGLIVPAAGLLGEGFFLPLFNKPLRFILSILIGSAVGALVPVALKTPKSPRKERLQKLSKSAHREGPMNAMAHYAFEINC